MKIVLLGAPGAGKGTQAKRLSAYYNMPHISTGDILRASMKKGDALGKKIEDVVNSGTLVSDDLMLQIIQQRLGEADTQAGFLLDGYPRNVAQAQKLAEIVPIDGVILLSIDPAIVIERLSGRRSHPQSGRVYHIKYNPPSVAGKDNETGEPLIQRDDDKEDVIEHRLDVYAQQSASVVAFYQEKGIKIVSVDAVLDVEEITQNIIKQL